MHFKISKDAIENSAMLQYDMLVNYMKKGKDMESRSKNGGQIVTVDSVVSVEQSSKER